jgi:hypothetical protein
VARKTETTETTSSLDLTNITPAELLEDEGTLDHSHDYIPATRTGGLVIQDDLGELDEGTLKKPYMSVVHGVGEAADDFNPGDLILDKEHLLATKNNPVEIIILNRDAYIKEYMDYTPGVFPRLFKTKEDAKEAGLRTEWVDGQGPQARPAMDLTVLIKKPEGSDCPLFNINLGTEDEWALAIFSRDKTAYDVLMDDIRHIAKGKLRSTGWYGGVWEFYTDVKVFRNGNKTWVARARFSGMLPEDQYKIIADTLGG